MARKARRPQLEVLEGRLVLSAAPPAAVGGAIRGVVFEDRDGDGVREVGEDGLAGRVVFLDADRDGALDMGEARTTTGANGAFAFTGLAPGRYTLGRVLPPGWVSTGHSVPPSAWPVGPAARLIGLDRLRADPRFAGLDGHGQSVVVIDTRVEGSHPFFGPDNDHNGRGDAIVVGLDFRSGSSAGDDAAGHGTHVASVIGSRDPRIPGIAPDVRLITLAALDEDGNGSFRDIEKALRWTIDNAARYRIAAVNLSFGDGGHHDTLQALHGIDDELAALAAKGVLVVAATGNDHARGGPSGIAYPAASADVQAVGAVWASNAGAVAWEGGASDYSTAPDRIVSFSQRAAGLPILFAPGALLVGAGRGGSTSTESGTSVASAVVSGAVALAQQLAREHLGRALSVAELRDLLARTGRPIRDGDDEDDNVFHTGAEFRRLDVHALALAIWAMKGPPGGNQARPTVSLGSGQIIPGVAFADFRLGRIAGTVYHDADADGRRDAGEAGIAGRTVFLDANGDGRLGANERRTVTGAEGRYAFEGLGPGTVEVRQVLPAGQRATTPPARVKITSGAQRTGVDHGSAPFNRPPELIGQGTLSPVAANDPSPRGDTVRALLGDTFRDGNPGTVPGIAIQGATGQGKWQLSLDQGRSWSDLGAVSPTRVRLLAGEARLRFLPARDWIGTAVLHYRGWDGSAGQQGGWANPATLPGALSLQAKQANLVVAPIVHSSRSPIVPTIAASLAQAGQPLGDARGIALERATGPGRWEYSPDGHTWRELLSPAAGQVLLLPREYRLRFVAREGAVGFPLVTYRQWLSGGWSGQVASATAPGIGEQRFGVELA